MIADLRDFLQGSTDVANLTGSRLEYGFARQGTAYPLIILNQINNTTGQNTLSGESDISRLSVQIDCWATDTSGGRGRVKAQSVADAVRNRISGYRGSMGNALVRSCTMTRQSQTDEEPEDGSSYRRHRVGMDFDILFYRAKPDFT